MLVLLAQGLVSSSSILRSDYTFLFLLTYMICGLFVLHIKFELGCIHPYAIHNCFVGS